MLPLLHSHHQQHHHRSHRPRPSYLPFRTFVDNTELIATLAYPKRHKLSFLQGPDLRFVGAHQRENGYIYYFLGLQGPACQMTQATTAGSFNYQLYPPNNWKLLQLPTLTHTQNTKFRLTWHTSNRLTYATTFNILYSLPPGLLWTSLPLGETPGTLVPEAKPNTNTPDECTQHTSPRITTKTTL